MVNDLPLEEIPKRDWRLRSLRVAIDGQDTFFYSTTTTAPQPLPKGAESPYCTVQYVLQYCVCLLRSVPNVESNKILVLRSIT